MDPLAFRLKNYAEVEPISGQPFSSKALRECYRKAPSGSAGSVGRWRPGKCAIATACWSAGAWAPRHFRPSCSRRRRRAVLRRDGSGVMEIGAHDMGQGAWTALAQIAADGLGLDLEQLEFRSGSSDLPDGGIAGGSAPHRDRRHGDPQCRRRRRSRGWPILPPAMSARRCSARAMPASSRVAAACSAATMKAAAKAMPIFSAAPGSRRSKAAARAGADPAAQVELCHACAWRGLRRGQSRSRARPDPRNAAGGRLRGRTDHQSAHGGEPVYGGMIWGVSFALHEQADCGPAVRASDECQSGRVPRPVNADVPSLEAILVEERRSVRQRARHQGRGRDRHHRHGRRGRQRGLARHRHSRAQIPDHARSPD